MAMGETGFAISTRACVPLADNLDSLGNAQYDDGPRFQRLIGSQPNSRLTSGRITQLKIHHDE
jgi:hypothetical protein